MNEGGSSLGHHDLPMSRDGPGHPMLEPYIQQVQLDAAGNRTTATKTFVCRDGIVIFEGAQDVQGDFDLHEAFVEIHLRTIRMKPRAGRNKMVFGRADRFFNSVWVLHVGRYQAKSLFEFLDHLQEQIAALDCPCAGYQCGWFDPGKA
jgi:hypothetical protein